MNESRSHLDPVRRTTLAGRIDRRTFLAAVTTTAGASITGCLGTGAARSADATAAKEDLGRQPHLGPPPGEARGLIVAFEDPSCPVCRRFEETTFPQLEAKLVRTGKTTFVYREFPHVRDWAGPASQALEATFAYDAEAFWGLKSYYYDEQDAFSTADVFEKTHGYLESRPDLDADTVVSEAREKAYDSAVRVDENARKKAGVRHTPTFFLFTDGSYDTKIVGSQDYDVFASALEG